MDDAKDRQLARVDEGKRDFLKKLAIGTAYAAPVIATFSLDSVRNKAHAQSVYTDPEVLSVRAVPASAVLDYLYGPPPTPFNSGAPYYYVITYDRPMDPAYASAKICQIEHFESTYYCDDPPVTDPVPADSCGTCSLTWEWSADRTQERAAAPMVSPTYIRAQRLNLWLNHASCAADAFYRDPNGRLLPPFVGVTDLCGIPPA